MSERLSNISLNGCLVRKGCVVSYGGLRLEVLKVRMGVFVGRKLSFGPVSGQLYQRDLRLKCESVQVVSPLPGAGRKAAPPVSRVGAMGAALPL